MKSLATLFFLFTLSAAMAQQLIVEEKVKFLALGDSYTIGESVSQSGRWPVQLISRLRQQGMEAFDARIIATTGWRTDNLKNAINSANLTADYNLVSLLIGVNNQYQGRSVESYKPEFEELLQMAIELAGNDKTHVFVLSIPDYGYTPFGKNNQPAISAAIDVFNAANKAITDMYDVTYINITDISRRGFDQPFLVASDGLHPSSSMYAEWVDRIMEAATLIKNPTVSIEANKETETFAVPNPFQDRLIVNGNKTRVRIMDISGRLVVDKILTSEESVIDTRAWSPGLYLLESRYVSGITFKQKLVKYRN